MALPALLWLTLAANAQQTLRVEVLAPPELGVGALRVRTQWLGQPIDQALEGPAERTSDAGVWTAELGGEPLRVAALEVVGEWAGAPVTLWAGTLALVPPEDTLSLRVEPGQPPQAQRVVALPARGLRERAGARALAASLGWAGLVFLYVAWLVGRALPPDPA